MAVFLRLTKAAFVLAAIAACASACSTASTTAPTATPKSRLDIVLERGKLACGVSGEVPGFSFVDRDGKYSGLDVDFCRAIAAALFDDPNAVTYRNLNAKERFTALQTGEIDVLIRNTTWTISRDTSTGMEFAPVTFYDGQGLMVRASSGMKRLEDLKGASICIQSGTTTELNLSDQMRKRNTSYQPLTFEDVNATFAAYEAGRCKGVTADRSQLVARRSLLSKPDDHVLLDVVMSKEPLAPSTNNNDSKWSDAVKWIVYAPIAAEELGLTSNNVGNQSGTQNSEVKRFLGLEGDLGKNMGLTNDFAARVVKHVGNYGEIYERNLGAKSKLNLPRALNRLWTDGGLMYAPPFR